MTVDVAPIVPVPDALTSFFWEGASQKRLLIQRCTDCGFYMHFPRPCCKKCLSFDLKPSEVSGRGTVYSFTVGMHPFHPWLAQRIPYLLAVVELEEQRNLKMVTNLVECTEDEVHCDMDVEVTYEQLSDEIWLPVFRPRNGIARKAV